MIAFFSSSASDFDDDINGLKDFSTAMFVEAAVRCLRVIDPTEDLHHKLPPNMAAQFRAGASIASAIQVS